MIIGITGGIACGKSIVADTLEKAGARVVDCDVLAREFVQPGSGALATVKAVFGESVVLPDGSLDRKKLAAKIFESPRERAKLEGILHPLIIERLQSEIEKSNETGETLVIIAPLLIETNLGHLVDQIWVVRSKEAAIIGRIRKRDGMSVLDAMRRIGAQMPIDEKSKYADVLIDNDGTIDELRKKVRVLWETAEGRLVGTGADGDDK